MPRYIVQHNGLPPGNETQGPAAYFGTVNSRPYRLYDTQDERSVGFYTCEEDAELLARFMNGPEADGRVIAERE